MPVVLDYRICSMTRNVVRTTKNFNVNEEALVVLAYFGIKEISGFGS